MGRLVEADGDPKKAKRPERLDSALGKGNVELRTDRAHEAWADLAMARDRRRASAVGAPPLRVFPPSATLRAP